MSQDDYLWADVLSATPRMKDPEQIRLELALLRPLDRFEHRAHRNLQAARKAAAEEERKSPDPQLKIKKNATTFTSTTDRDSIAAHVEAVRYYLGSVQDEGRKLRRKIEDYQEHANRILKAHKLLKET